jgi:hypothetical protein
MQNNTPNGNASADCSGKDAKTASFLVKRDLAKKRFEEKRNAKPQVRRPAADYASICCASRSRLNATRRSRATAAK